MSQNEADYDSIRIAWERELESDSLLDLEDLELSGMVSCLSNIRMQLARTKAEQELKASILTQEVMNLEFMIKDLLLLRKRKILAAVVSGKDIHSKMALQEEEFYNRLKRAFNAHQNFIDMKLAGKTGSEDSALENEETPSHQIPEDMDDEAYVLVRFLEPIEDKFIHLDGAEYGPYRAEDLATIPAGTAKTWLSKEIVARVVPEDLERSGSRDEQEIKQSDQSN